MRGFAISPGFAAMIVVVAAVAVVVAIFIYVPFSPRTSAPTNSSGGAKAQLPASMQAALAYGPVNMSVMIQLMINKLVNSSQFNVSYTGNFASTPQNTSLANYSLNVPLHISYMRYNGASRLTITAGNTPIFGNFTLMGIKNGSSAYTCTNLLSSISGLYGGKNASSSSNFTCSKSSLQASSLTQLNSYTSGLNSSTALTVHLISQKSYNGNPCWLVYGNTSSTYNSTIGGNASTIKKSSTFTACFSTQYDIPLNITSKESVAYRGYSSNTALTLNETSIGNPVTQSEVTTLPGPLQKGYGYP